MAFCCKIFERTCKRKSGVTNTGNFIELLNHPTMGRDNALENHLGSAKQNDKYTSPEIQNDLLLCYMDFIVENLNLK